MKRIKLFFFELNYKLHLSFRYLHDLLYSKNGLYKRYSDRGYIAAVHHAVLLGFLVSVIIFFAHEIGEV